MGAGLLRERPRGREERRVGLRGAQSVRELRGPPRRHASGDQVFGKGDRAGQKIVHDRVDDAVRPGVRGGDRLAGDDHRQRLLHARQARQSLRAFRAGDDAQRDFRQPQLCVRHRDAKMAGHRQFQAAAERRAVDGEDDRLRALLHAAQQRPQVQRRVELPPREALQLGDVGAPGERAPGAQDHHGGNAGIRSARSMAPARPSRTAELRAFTGGLSTCTTRTRP